MEVPDGKAVCVRRATRNEFEAFIDAVPDLAELKKIRAPFYYELRIEETCKTKTTAVQ